MKKNPHTQLAGPGYDLSSPPVGASKTVRKDEFDREKFWGVIICIGVLLILGFLVGWFVGITR